MASFISFPLFPLDIHWDVCLPQLPDPRSITIYIIHTHTIVEFYIEYSYMYLGLSLTPLLYFLGRKLILSDLARSRLWDTAQSICPT